MSEIFKKMINNLLTDKEVKPKMKKYKVSLWFGDKEGDPSTVVLVKTDKTEKRDIIHEALKKVGEYPRTYEVKVEEASFDKFHVVMIRNVENTSKQAWYHGKAGELYVVYEGTDGKYVTANALENSSYGIIHPDFCKIITSFDAEDSY